MVESVRASTSLRPIQLLALAAAMLAAPSEVAAWGFVAHRIVTENAASSMPPELAAFFKAASPRLSDASIEPDSILKERDGEREKRRHFFDLDELGRPPFSGIPRDEDEARARFGSDRVNQAGLLPWRVAGMLDQLRDAFKRRDAGQIATKAGWLAHYVADVYQPLHTTKNFDGQETCNQGVHSAYEADLIDLSRARYRADTELPDSFVPERVREPKRFVFAELIATFPLAEKVLDADTQSVLAVRRRRADYYREMESRLGALTRDQLRRAAASVASLWYTAWMDAGRPQLPAWPPPTAGKP